jgi:V/A-type H+-transporting ATPase subunit I
MHYTADMRLRPRPAQLFELYTPRHQTVHALEVLAGTGAVELDTNPKIDAGLETGAIGDAIRKFDRLVQPYQDYLPEHERRPYALDKKPDQLAQDAIAVIERWLADVAPLVDRLRALQAERDNLILLQEYLASLGQTHEDVSLLSRPGGLLYKGLYACPHEQTLEGELVHVFKEVVSGPRHRFLILVGLPEQAPQIESAVREGTCYRLDMPAWLAPRSEDWPAQVGARLEVVRNDLAMLQRAVGSVKDDRETREALQDMALLKWYTQQATALRTEGKYCHIAGWTSYSEPGQLEGLLRQHGIDAFVRFLRFPVSPAAPLKTLDTWWARPFQPFLGMYGVPEEGEVDPSVVVVFVVPLLFGYMFPDVGHGLLLVLFSTMLYRRWPEGRFLIPCGLSAMLFGLAFGEVFGFEKAIQPLWLKPLEQPLAVLFAPLVFGAGLIFLGLLFSGVESYWRAEFRAWLLADAALLALYVSALAAFFHPFGYYAAASALVWFVAGSLIRYRQNARHGIGRSLGRLLESVFQLAVNTISFLRVGVFALGHAAISSAMMQLAGMMPSRWSYWIVLIVSQIVIVTLETLVVFVQTTRLIFFEFFIRFLRAEGRVFKPLHAPGIPDRTDAD